jgi:hypothetical protein
VFDQQDGAALGEITEQIEGLAIVCQGREILIHVAPVISSTGVRVAYA